jgi:nicotinamidase-related amidase
VLDAALPLGMMIAHTRYGFAPDLSNLPELTPAEGEIVVNKPNFGAFGSTDLHDRLCARGVTHLWVCGVTTQCCVEGTIREAVDLGY